MYRLDCGCVTEVTNDGRWQISEAREERHEYLWNQSSFVLCHYLSQMKSSSLLSYQTLKFRQFRTHLHYILVSTVQICKPMIQNNVEKFRPIHGLSFTQQSNFDMLNNFLRNQLKKAASVPDFSSTSVKNGLFEKILLQN